MSQTISPAPTMRPAKVVHGIGRYKSLLVRIGVALVLSYLLVASLYELEIVRLRGNTCTNDGPVIYGEITFHCMADFYIYVLSLRRSSFFPWSKYLEQWQALAVVASCSGFWGGLVREIRNKVLAPNLKFRPYSLLGLAMGLSILVVSALSAALLLKVSTQFNMPSIVGVCFLAGCFSPEAWSFLANLAKTTFIKE